MSGESSFKANRPQSSQSGFSGSMPYNYGGSFGSLPPQEMSYRGATISKLQNGSSYQNNAAIPATYTIQICVDGVPKKLDVLVVGEPY